MKTPSHRPAADAVPMLDDFARRHRLDPREALPWIAAVAAYFAFPDYLALQAQILATIIFALSVDLVLGYAGIVTLGHAAFFGVGAYTAGLLAPPMAGASRCRASWPRRLQPASSASSRDRSSSKPPDSRC
jgi:ABC-type branched-subunit amino acid transport system permease subunit